MFAAHQATCSHCHGESQSTRCTRAFMNFTASGWGRSSHRPAGRVGGWVCTVGDERSRLLHGCLAARHFHTQAGRQASAVEAPPHALPPAHPPARPPTTLPALPAALPAHPPVLWHGVGTAKTDSLVPSRSAVVQERSSPTGFSPAPSRGGGAGRPKGGASCGLGWHGFSSPAPLPPTSNLSSAAQAGQGREAGGVTCSACLPVWRGLTALALPRLLD